MQIGLNLDKNHWRDISDDIKTGTWKEVAFNESSVEIIRQFPPTRAVYMLILNVKSFSSREPFESLKSVLYVGHSTNLRQRFKDHIKGGKDDNLRYKVKDHLGRGLRFWYVDLGEMSEENLKLNEQALIDLFGKNLNSINSVSKKKAGYKIKKIEAIINVKNVRI